jgi:hypothetical protein
LPSADRTEIRRGYTTGSTLDGVKTSQALFCPAILQIRWETLMSYVIAAAALVRAPEDEVSAAIASLIFGYGPQ